VLSKQTQLAWSLAASAVKPGVSVEQIDIKLEMSEHGSGAGVTAGARGLRKASAWMTGRRKGSTARRRIVAVREGRRLRSR
jgi:hypothetical protein